jgi:hypothetical protein
MRSGTKPALYLLAALVAAQLAGVEGCDISLPSGERAIDVPGLAVLIVYESGQTLPKEQQAILTSAQWTALVPPGNYRVLDQNSEFATDSPWKTAMQRPRTQLPHLIVSSDKGNYEGPLPADTAAMVAKVQEYQ